MAGIDAGQRRLGYRRRLPTRDEGKFIPNESRDRMGERENLILRKTDLLIASAICQPSPYIALTLNKHVAMVTLTHQNT